jgi:hypothetical protein
MPSESSRPMPKQTREYFKDRVEELEADMSDLSEECVYLRNELAHFTGAARRYKLRAERIEKYARANISKGSRGQVAQSARAGLQLFLRILKKETA